MFPPVSTVGVHVQLSHTEHNTRGGVVVFPRRPQLMYTEEDRDVMQEAWELTAAHREDLAGRPGNPQAAPAVGDRPSVLDMLRTVRE